MKESSRTKIYGLLMLASVIWGFQPVTLKWLLPEWTPTAITTVRLCLFGIMLLLYSWYREGRRLLPDRHSLAIIMTMSLCYVLNNILQFTGLRYTTVTNTTLIVALGPALTAVLAAVFLRERLSGLAKLGVAVSLIGSLVVISNGDVGIITGIAFNIGDLFCVLAQLSWTGYTLLTLGLLKKMSIVTVTGWSALFSSVYSYIYGLLTEPFVLTALSPLAMGAFFYILFFGGIVATLAWNLGVKSAGASVTSIFLYLMPVVGMLSGWLILGEEISVAKLVGAATIFGGVYLTTHNS